MDCITEAGITLLDYHPETDTFWEEVRAGLQAEQKRLPSKFFYDAEGSRLFDAITELPEYYLTRTEMAIMRQHIGQIVAHLGRKCLLVEYGSGSSLKTRILLDHLSDPAGYVPIDISKEHLLASAAALAAAYPHLRVLPVCTDYTTMFEFPEVVADGRPVVFFPGSTIGNFTPEEAVDFLRHVHKVVGPGGGLLIGVDLKKARAVIEAAYNDSQGITAAFNLNMLARINRELNGTFDLDLFEHYAFYNEEQGRIEMHLMSTAEQRVRIGEMPISFEQGETILTEYSYKYSLEDFRALAGEAGFRIEHVWTDENQWFSVQALVARAG